MIIYNGHIIRIGMKYACGRSTTTGKCDGFLILSYESGQGVLYKSLTGCLKSCKT